MLYYARTRGSTPPLLSHVVSIPSNPPYKGVKPPFIPLILGGGVTEDFKAYVFLRPMLRPNVIPAKAGIQAGNRVDWIPVGVYLVQDTRRE